MLRAAAATPRKKFPPPTTRPICTPPRATSATSSARLRTRSESTPNEPCPASASPLIFRRMRLYFGMLRRSLRLWSGLLGRFLDYGHVANLETHEARNRDILAQLGDLRLNEIGDGGGVLANERLLVEADLFVILVQPSLDDLVHHLLRLAFTQRAGAIDLFLAGQRFRRNILAADELRIGGSHLHGQILHQLLKIRGARDEIGLAVHLDENADLRSLVNVGTDDALFGDARRLLRRGSDALLAQD